MKKRSNRKRGEVKALQTNDLIIIFAFRMYPTDTFKETSERLGLSASTIHKSSKRLEQSFKLFKLADGHGWRSPKQYIINYIQNCRSCFDAPKLKNIQDPSLKRVQNLLAGNPVNGNIFHYLKA